MSSYQEKRGGYGVILADCPWSYERAAVHGSAALEYKTMSLDDICALPVSEVASRDAVLLLWATWPLLPEGLQVMQAWGFSYKAGFPWIKIRGFPQPDLWGEVQFKPVYGVGWWVRGCSEIVMVGVRGKVSPPDAGFVGLLSSNFQHSRKPENVHEYAESLPGPYLELFARRSRPGWLCLGNEIDGCDIREALALAHVHEVEHPAQAPRKIRPKKSDPAELAESIGRADQMSLWDTVAAEDGARLTA